MFAQIIVESSQCLEPSFTSKYVVPIMPYFEIFYYLCTFGLLIVAIIGLKQIVMGRRIAKINAKRDALKVAAGQCRIYADKIIPLSSILKAKTRDIPFFDISTFSVRGSIITVKTKETIQDLIPQLIDVYSDYVMLFNAIESFSQYLTSGLADEKNAYYCLGDAHLHIVSRYIPLLVLQAQEGNMWCNTLHIFVVWYERQKREEIEQKKRLLAKKEESLDKEMALYEENGISILDVDSFCNCSHKKKRRKKYILF